jgi:hypothetical protein
LGGGLTGNASVASSIPTKSVTVFENNNSERGEGAFIVFDHVGKWSIHR